MRWLLRLLTAGIMEAGLLAACGSGGDGDPTPDGGLTPDSGPSVLDGGGDPAVPPDGAALCPSGTCNYQTQSGCAAGESCWPLVASDGTVSPGCLGAGTGTVGAACTDWTECAAGSVCVGGVCRTLCCGRDWSACAPDESCFHTLELQVGDASVPSGVDLCFPVNDCDVLDPQACADQAGLTCQVVDPRGSVACMPEGTGAVGDACTAASGCRAGLACIGDECRRLCRAIEGGEPACQAGEGVCVHYVRDPEGVGECTPLTTP